MLLTPLRFLPLEPAQLSLASVLRCGQTFLWRRSPARATLPDKKEEGACDGPSSSMAGPELFEWSYGHKDRSIVLRQDASGLHYRSLFPPHYSAAYQEDLANDTTLAFIRRYFVLDTSLPPLYSFWSARDRNFALKTDNGRRFGGIRILRQPAWECLLEFICSSNNHISRIEGMLRRMCALYGERLPSPVLLDPNATPSPETDLFAFPKPEVLLASNVTAELRAAGFGYRDAYITKTAALVCSMAEDAGYTRPEDFLETVASKTEDEAREILLKFAGVGPKVADCILLFGLGFEDVVPVDTHVYQIAIRDYGLKGSKDASMSRPLYQKVKDKLLGVWGEKAGWAHQILFTADLKSAAEFQDPLLLRHASASVSTTTTVKTENEEAVITTVKVEEQQTEFITQTPGKRNSARSFASPGSSTASSVSTPDDSGRKMTSRKRKIQAMDDSVDSQPQSAYPTPPATPLAVKAEPTSYVTYTTTSSGRRVRKTVR